MMFDKKEYQREYNQRPGVKKRRDEYAKRPEVKVMKREYLREYNQRPENKKRNAEYQREYRQRPEVREKMRAYWRLDAVKSRRVLKLLENCPEQDVDFALKMIEKLRTKKRPRVVSISGATKCLYCRSEENVRNYGGGCVCDNCMKTKRGD